MAALDQTIEKGVAGLAKEIRASMEDQLWDLANYTESQATSLVKAAFQESIELESMIRHTFIIGGGKKVRSKYDDKLSKYFVTVLREIGFEEDRTATATMDCAGKYKQQHDTDKDLKFIHVFPRVDLKSSSKGAAAEDSSDLMDLGSPGYLATVCALPTFKKMVASKTQSWAQRRELVSELKASANRFDAIEQKMMTGKTLNSDEQDLYDVTSREGIDEKVTWLESTIKQMVDDGQLTMGEKSQLLHQMDSKIQLLEQEIQLSKTEGKAKKVEKLSNQLTNVTTRRDFVKGIDPIVHPLKHEEKILSLRMLIIPLLQLEASAGLRSMEEMKKIGARPDYEDEVTKLEQESRGWFEDDNDFESRCSRINAAAVKKVERAQSKKKPSGGGKKVEEQWETVGSMGNGTSNKGKRR